MIEMLRLGAVGLLLTFTFGAMHSATAEPSELQESVFDLRLCLEGKTLAAVKNMGEETAAGYVEDVNTAATLQNNIWDFAVKACKDAFHQVELEAFAKYGDNRLKDAYVTGALDFAHSWEFGLIDSAMRSLVPHSQD